MSSAVTPPPPAGDLPGSGDSRAPEVIASGVILWLVAAGFVGLRFYIRTKIVHVFGAEDWTLLVALICSLGHSICQCLTTTMGYGKHVWTLAPDDFSNQAKTVFALQGFYMFSLALTKISILVLYLRILTYHHARWLSWIIIVITVVYNLAALIMQVTVCIPIQKLWDSTSYGTCHPHPQYASWILVALTVSTDLVTFAMPIPIITKMTLPLREKLVVITLICVGFFECLVSIIRVIIITQLVESPDFTWDFVPITHWNCVEVNVAIVCACLLTMKPLINKKWPGFLSHPSVEGEGEARIDHVPAQNDASSDQWRIMDSSISGFRLHTMDTQSQKSTGTGKEEKISSLNVTAGLRGEELGP